MRSARCPLRRATSERIPKHTVVFPERRVKRVMRVHACSGSELYDIHKDRVFCDMICKKISVRARDRCQYLSLLQPSTRTSTPLSFSASLLFDEKYLSFSNLPETTFLKSSTVVPETPLYFCTSKAGSTAVPVQRDVLADVLGQHR